MMKTNNHQKSNVKKLTEEINAIYNNGLSVPKNTPETNARFNAQVAYEEKYKEDNRLCHTDGSGLAQYAGVDTSLLSGVHKDQLSSMLKHQFYDYNFMTEMRCMINTIIDIKDGDDISERARIHRFIADPKRFGAPSAYNYALRSDINSNENYGKDTNKYDSFRGDMVVVKCPREPSSAKELIHELCVGIRLEELRKYGCCNFSTVYDAWYCGAPVVNDSYDEITTQEIDKVTGKLVTVVKKVPSKNNNEVINWCMASDNPVSYVAYEMIHDAKPMNDIASDFSENVHLKMAMYLMQMSQAEFLAENLFGFQHYDAHGGNLLLRPFPTFTKNKETNKIISGSIEPFYKYYNFAGVECYVPTPGEIVTFIDYGMSRCVMEDGTAVGKLDASGASANVKMCDPECGNVIGDIYKLICCILLQSMQNNNKKLTIFLGTILNDFFYRDSEFNWDNIQEAIIEQLDLVYLFPPPLIDKYGLNVYDFIIYLREHVITNYNFELMYTSENLPQGAKIFGYAEHFQTYEEIKKEIGLVIPEIPTLFDLSNAISSESDKLSIIKNNVINHIGEVIHNERMSINSLIHAKNPNAFHPLGKGRINIENEEKIASRNIEDVAAIANNCYNIIEKLRVYRNCQTILSSNELNILVSECQKRFTNDSHYIERIKTHLMVNFVNINNALKEPRRDIKTEEDSENPDPLFNLSDKYEKTISALRKMSITL